MNLADKIIRNKINTVQLDPFGFCNAKCWFCPVRYKPQPEIGLSVMSVELLEQIIQEIDNEKKKGDVVNPNLDLILTAHYNEILLYKHIEDLFKILRKYKLKTFVLSNGISLSKEKTNLIKEYIDVVEQVGLNIPAFEPELWAKRSGFNIELFDRLMNNLYYADEQLASTNYNIQIHVNGVGERLDMIDTGPGFDSIGKSLTSLSKEHNEQFDRARQLFPKWGISKSDLFDRAGSIDIISNQRIIRAVNNNKKVIGCDSWRGDRTLNWLHINSVGQTFLCCNDYNFDYVFGDLTKQSLQEIWASERHIETIERAYNEICAKCLFAKFDK